MKVISVATAEQSHIDKMKGNIRKSDHRECFAATHTNADDALQRALDTSFLCWVGLSDDEPFIAFGVSGYSSMMNKGIVWMLATDQINEFNIKNKVVRHCKHYIAYMIRPFQIIENHVHIQNFVSIKWLLWCGFSFDEPEPYGLDNELFHHFYMRKV